MVFETAKKKFNKMFSNSSYFWIFFAKSSHKISKLQIIFYENQNDFFWTSYIFLEMFSTIADVCYKK